MTERLLQVKDWQALNDGMSNWEEAFIQDMLLRGSNFTEMQGVKILDIYNECVLGKRTD